MNRTMIVTVAALALAAAFHAVPAWAQNTRSFVSGQGSDSNPCTLDLPCRGFARAFTETVAGGEISVLNSAGYGQLTITHAISIVAPEGVEAGITVPSGDNAITINAGAGDIVSLRGLIIDGEGVGYTGIAINSGTTVEIYDCVIRHFTNAAVNYSPTTAPASLLVSNTVASDSDYGVFIQPFNGTSDTPVILDRLVANNNSNGVFGGYNHLMLSNSVISNNTSGVSGESGGTIRLAKNVISGNGTGVDDTQGVTINSYGDNYINGNTTDVSGSPTSVATR